MGELKKQKKVRRLPLISTGILVLLIILSLTVWNPPQCPYNYTQEQIDASNCIVGANIGLGMVFMVIIAPLALVVVVLWSIALIQRLNKKKT